MSAFMHNLMHKIEFVHKQILNSKTLESEKIDHN